MNNPPLLSQIDHLVYACANLEAGIAEIEQLTGAKVQPGGVHQGRGSHNALLSLGANCYLEIIAPDPSQSNVARPLWMGLDQLKESRLTRWCVKSSELNLLQQKTNALSLDIGTIQKGQRSLPNGDQLNWQLSDPKACAYDGLIPFFIDWQNSPHPASQLPAACELIAVEAQHPEGDLVASILQKIDLNLNIKSGTEVKLTAHIQTPKGLLIL